MMMKTDRVEKPKPTVMFAECKENPGKLQVWFPAHSIIYSQCNQCGTITSYAHSGVCVNYVDHYNLYEIEVKRNRGEPWEEYWERAEQMVLQNMKKYFKK